VAEVPGLVKGGHGKNEAAFWVEDIWTAKKWCAEGGVGGNG